MNSIILATLNTLEKSRNLLSILTDEELSNNSIPPYYSSIGSHIRHIYDFYDCSLNIDSDTKVDLTARKRIESIERCCDTAIYHLDGLIGRLKMMETVKYDNLVVIDDLGFGKVEIPYTFSALLAQANSHTIHHYAIINYILDRLGIVIKDADFGYNPTTPKEVSS